MVHKASSDTRLRETIESLRAFLFKASAAYAIMYEMEATTMEAKDSHGFNQVVEENDKSADRAWVKPTLERLSLKQALSGTTGAIDSTNPGS
jgi:hypothetical protein